MLGCYEKLASRPCYSDTLKILQADIHHANLLAASIPRGKEGSCVEMKLVYNELAPIFMCLLQWMDCSSSFLFSNHLNLFHVMVHKVRSEVRPKISKCGRKATVAEFYNVILPSLKRLHADSLETKNQSKIQTSEMRKSLDVDFDRDDECGICLEPCSKIVVPICWHEMCINCYHDWNARSKSCPFCRGSLKRVNSDDLWVLTSTKDVVDTQTILNDDVSRFYIFINTLPKDIPDTLFIMYYEYLF